MARTDEFVDFAAEGFKEILRSNQPINSVFSGLYFFRNIAKAEENYAKNGGKGSVLGGAFKETFKGEAGKWDTFSVGENKYSGKAIAGAGSMLGLGYRAISGGGAYRDSDGEFDIAGIPFL